jgi:hypothetical protein
MYVGELELALAQNPVVQNVLLGIVIGLCILNVVFNRKKGK